MSLHEPEEPNYSLWLIVVVLIIAIWKIATGRPF
jgi:hypothetical protein